MARQFQGSRISQRSRSAVPCLAMLGGLCALVHASLSFALPPVTGRHATKAASAPSLFVGPEPAIFEQPSGHPAVAMEAVGIGAKVLGAMSAGLVASVVSAALAAVTEPVMNRVLVKRMSVAAAMAEMSPKMILSFFSTTMSTNLLKFPLFEAVSMFLSLLPNMSNVVRGLIVGFIFTTATLPITNFRYRMSIQTPVAEAMNPKLLYQAYLPTVVRDMIYAIGRNLLTVLLLAKFSGLAPASPALMFPVVIGACVLSAPLNEVRGFLLQSGDKKLSFQEFFKPVNFIRSTSLGALNMGVSVATGYYLTPIVGRFIARTHGAVNGGNLFALIGVVLSLDLVGFLIASGFSRKVFTRRIDANKEQVDMNTENVSDLLKRMETLEAANKSLSSKVVALGGKVDEK
mmetsp:Transcript_4202/g.8481  ORF Transcript_4202/g.8481 Transcript_4202/m.8481 type:complete len:402 (-) Transcript_4202:140-1345(-)